MYAQRANYWRASQNDPALASVKASKKLYARTRKRVAYSAMVIFSVDANINTGKVNGDISVGKVINLSTGGAAIQTYDTPSIGDILIVSIPYAKKQRKVRRRASVCWVRGKIFGIKFLPHKA